MMNQLSEALPTSTGRCSVNHPDPKSETHPTCYLPRQTGRQGPPTAFDINVANPPRHGNFPKQGYPQRLVTIKDGSTGSIPKMPWGVVLINCKKGMPFSPACAIQEPGTFLDVNRRQSQTSEDSTVALKCSTTLQGPTIEPHPWNNSNNPPRPHLKILGKPSNLKS